MTRVHEGAGPALRSALESPAASGRLHAALTAGMHPNPEYVEVLVERCAVEPDFSVRDMLTWALTRHDASVTVERLLSELGSEVPQGRSQALHTLSKIGDARTWPAITVELLTDEDDEVARTAWRTAAALVPEGRETELAATLSTQFDRGDGEVQRSLSRAFVALGDAVLPVVERATTARDPGVRAHAIATTRLMQHPDEGFDAAIAEARRVVALRGAPLVGEHAEC
ncbi:HEAT repeat domain-containing protein [Pseudonocardia sp. NPDC049154]|uniref:HEAT repeat domain-containing protein n=1 Tax=Pseudonocardia sp. NPDC049154 TaxID=3155501 RepID=UPI003407568D